MMGLNKTGPPFWEEGGGVRGGGRAPVHAESDRRSFRSWLRSADATDTAGLAVAAAYSSGNSHVAGVWVMDALVKAFDRSAVGGDDRD